MYLFAYTTSIIVPANFLIKAQNVGELSGKYENMKYFCQLKYILFKFKSEHHSHISRKNINKTNTVQSYCNCRIQRRQPLVVCGGGLGGRRIETPPPVSFAFFPTRERMCLHGTSAKLNKSLALV